MSRFLLDTNICIYVINKRPLHVIDRFKAVPAGSVAISSISAAELAYGVEKSGSPRNRKALEYFLSPIEILPFDEEALWAYGKLRAALEKDGKPIGSMDTLIAAHALALDLTLVTNNEREFSRVDGLRIQNWAIN